MIPIKFICQTCKDIIKSQLKTKDFVSHQPTEFDSFTSAWEHLYDTYHGDGIHHIKAVIDGDVIITS